MPTLLEEVRDCLHGFAELYDATDAKALVEKVDDTASIVVKAVVYRCDNNRRLRSLELSAGPPHVMRHIGESPLYGTEGFNLIATLSQYGYEYTVITEYLDVSPMEMIDILAED